MTTLFTHTARNHKSKLTPNLFNKTRKSHLFSGKQARKRRCPSISQSTSLNKNASALSRLWLPPHSHERQKQLRIGLLNQSTSLQERCSPPFKALWLYLVHCLSALHMPSGLTIGNHQKRVRKLSHVQTCDTQELSMQWGVFTCDWWRFFFKVSYWFEIYWCRFVLDFTWPVFSLFTTGFCVTCFVILDG